MEANREYMFQVSLEYTATHRARTHIPETHHTHIPHTHTETHHTRIRTIDIRTPYTHISCTHIIHIHTTRAHVRAHTPPKQQKVKRHFECSGVLHVVQSQGLPSYRVVLGCFWTPWAPLKFGAFQLNRE